MKRKKLAEKYEELFQSQIISRGKEYYEDGKVLSVYKSDYKYIAKVEGSDYEEYNVIIELKNGEIDMQCSCPYEDNCKHEYATLMAIDNKDYTKINLLPIVDGEQYDIKDIIDNMPQEEVREYLFNLINNSTEYTQRLFIERFEDYLPERSKEFFYNTLYNDFILDMPMFNVEKFMRLARKNVENGKYSYAFDIVSAIIDAAKESDFEDDEDILFDEYGKMGMIIRIAYRKGNKTVKKNINKWIDKIKDNACYNDIFLEDMILTIK